MPRFSRDPLQKMVSLRLTAEQNRDLTEMASNLRLVGGKAELLRKALDYWLEHSPDAQRAQRKLGRKEEG
jgi:hypothetical protein